MIKINKKDLLNIKYLIKNETITEGKFVNQEIVLALKQNGSVGDGKKTPKVRYINLVKEENVFLFLKNNDYYINSMDEIDRYIEEIFDTKASRDTVQKWHNSSKAKDSKSLKGLYVSSLNTVDIKLNDATVSIIPNNGLGYFLFYTQKIELFDDTVIVGVENYQVIWFAKKYKQFFEGNNILFVVKTPYMLEWISSLENEYIHFGDYDLAGINIYLNTIIPRLKNSKQYSMFIPNNIEYLIQKHGDYELYEKQKNIYALVTSDIKINNLINMIRTNKKSIEQEGLYLL
ncbi:hypothetical protein JHD48_07445 [Sulfurimonas sp. SAG-AH-194-I05]|nr:hypothetical protein [Sulfurimonas sp. SAG-AH-194-I05]MDF1875565.1 hypothetical protein [Sulfurimonas sp. SAG-AH-194-I05]